ncbi:PLP-dependent aminotransferase family protein [Pseudomonas syringae]|uniref:aminotransferase-like domain-containing protein n=1 Tax=Pseudomonas syringae TaxID=317 RepID=UPI001373253B|nr:PLP-dependent aminotransferase family protein [Pseudomonas syringae]NAS98814.1 GntR family transcriptional regulator [Pseudomonas syringae pv. actinidifoliorum]NAT24524.1 GntR family transcriptional regulator [Pseudomonas syringae pv. actinidifoliorum]NAT65163.1 GntR family transcriptional regulator [Pseudomonas syringae pv. actinidifoliorum]
MNLNLDDLHASITDPALNSMNFLNEVAERYPQAISLAAGRPHEDLFELETVHRAISVFTRYLADECQMSQEKVRRTIFQYGPTAGIIQGLISEHLATDEDLQVDPHAVVITSGCQEAILLTLRVLCRDPGDVLLAINPTYVGLTGAARLLDIDIAAVATDATGVDFADFKAVVAGLRAQGRKPKACYVMPDFANPSGASMSLETRQALLEFAADEALFLIEDNPYGYFHGDDIRLPTLKALDKTRQVVYLGSFSKTIFPGARVGFVVADQLIEPAGAAGLLADQIAKVKSMVTVNTSPIVQAIIGGQLIEHRLSLSTATRDLRGIYERNRIAVLAALAEKLGVHDLPVSWNIPSGGFFLVLTVPFAADEAALAQCAQEFGVIWTPMTHFYLGKGGANQLRLSISALNLEQIEEGVERLSQFIRMKCDRELNAARISKQIRDGSTVSG